MEHWARDKKIWSLLCRLLSGWLRRKFNFSSEPVLVEGPCLVLANHCVDWDPLLLGIAFGPDRQMYFVASEHIFRWGLAYKLINWLLHPIARLKGATAADTVMTVMRRMRNGASVAIFAEGNRTWDGRTGYILPSTGKLARSCGGSLVTYKFEGGYFTSPRWAGKNLRRGQMRGRVVGVYSRDELRAMTADELNEIINRDLYEDAYARQRETPVAYKGHALAEGLETMLCLCPACGALGAMRTKGDRLFCIDCGFEARYDEYGFLSGDGAPCDNIPDWDALQTEKLITISESGAADDEFFHDEGVTLDTLSQKHGQTRLGVGALTMSRSAVSCCGYDFPLSDIEGMGMHGALGISLTYGGRHYELGGSRPCCLRKYMTIYESLRRKAQREGHHQ